MRDISICLCTILCVFTTMFCTSPSDSSPERSPNVGQKPTKDSQAAKLDPTKTPTLDAQWTAFESNDGWGYRDALGNVVIEPQFEMAFDFVNRPIGFAFHHGRWVCIGSDAQIRFHVLPFDNGPDPFVGGLARWLD